MLTGESAKQFTAAERAAKSGSMISLTGSAAYGHGDAVG